jgi:hypothetical protein
VVIPVTAIRTFCAFNGHGPLAVSRPLAQGKCDGRGKKGRLRYVDKLEQTAKQSIIGFNNEFDPLPLAGRAACMAGQWFPVLAKFCVCSALNAKAPKTGVRTQHRFRQILVEATVPAVGANLGNVDIRRCRIWRRDFAKIGRVLGEKFSIF